MQQQELEFQLADNKSDALKSTGNKIKSLLTQIKTEREKLQKLDRNSSIHRIISGENVWREVIWNNKIYSVGKRIYF